MAPYKITFHLSTDGERFGQPLEVEVDATPLVQLIAQARDGHRLYELKLIDRPGDIWEYVLVRPLVIPDALEVFIQRQRDAAAPSHGHSHPWLPDALPIAVFDQGFDWVDMDPMPMDLAWTRARHGAELTAFAARLLQQVRQAQWADDQQRPLEHHELELIKAQRHPFDRLTRAEAIKEGKRGFWAAPRHPQTLYARLSTLLADCSVTCASYRGDGDYEVIRQLCAVQRHRANRTGRAPRKALDLNALMDVRPLVANWGSDFLFRDSGLDIGDLHIEEHQAGRTIEQLLGRTKFRPRYILTETTEGHLEGYEAVSEDGWTLYTHRHPTGRRANLERLWRSRRLPDELAVVLHFGEPGKLILADDKLLVIVGPGVDAAARATLAAIIAEFEAHGGDPLVVVLGDADAFALAGCRGVHVFPDSQRASHPETWLASLLSQKRRWLDVALILNPPGWVGDYFLDDPLRDRPPWSPWSAGTSDCDPIPLDMTIGGNLADALADAHHRAQGLRL